MYVNNIILAIGTLSSAQTTHLGDSVSVYIGDSACFCLSASIAHFGVFV